MNDPPSSAAPPGIPTRPLGKTGVVVTELSLGTWGLSGEGYGPVPDGEAEAIVARALALGIDSFETSDAYEKGGTEERLGRLLEDVRGSTTVATRIGVDRSVEPPRKCFRPAYLEAAIQRSCERLRRPRLDVLLLHNPKADTLKDPELVSFLKETREKGLVRAWGVAAGDSEVARNALENGCDVLELAHNVLADGDLAAVSSDVEARSVGVYARSVLAYGLLAGFLRPDRVFAEGDHRRERWKGADLAHRMTHAECARVLVGGAVHTARAAAVRFALANELVSTVVLGPRSAAQLEQLVREAGRGGPYLEPERLAKLPRRLAEAGVFG